MAIVMSDEASGDEFDDPDIDIYYDKAYTCFIQDETLTDCLQNLDLLDPFDGVDELLDATQKLSAEPKDVPDTSFDIACLAGTDETRSAEINLYDSGVTRHMSGFQHRFFNFVDIHPIPITAADK